MGQLPEPGMIWSLAVANGHAYLLAFQAYQGDEDDMLVYELDLKAWHWRLLPYDAGVPTRGVRGPLVVVEASIFAHPGLELVEQGTCHWHLARTEHAA